MTSVRYRVLLITVLLLSPTNKIFATELFWSDWIQTSLLLRDSFNENTGISALPQPISSTDPLQILTLIKNVENEGVSRSPWYHYYTGISEKSSQNTSFSNCLEQSARDPGTTWLLAIEFYKNGFKNWTESALNQLERQMLESGAEQVTLISRQLLHAAIENQVQGNIKDATFFYSWALKLNTHESQTYIRNALFQFPHNIAAFFRTLFTLLQNAFSSWIIQIEVLASIYNSLKLWFLVFSVAITSLFLIKYASVALHRISDLLPPTVPLSIKTVFASIAYSAFIGFGLLPFLWCTAFVICRHLSRQEKILFSPVLLLLMFAPVDPHIQTIFSRSLNPEHPPMLFYRSVHEGFSNGIYKNIIRQVNEKPDNCLLVLAATNYALKNGDLVQASHYAEVSMKLRPNDPVVLTTSGNVAFLKGDISRAKKLYQQAITLDNKSAEAHYNAGQCHLRTIETTEGMEQINQAVALNPTVVNAFIQKNNLYFSDSIPTLRQIMFPDYSPGLFWSKFVLHSVYDSKSATKLWGTSMFGLSPWGSFFISLVLLVIYLLISSLPSENRVRKFFECSLCGRKICKRCRIGTLCKTCSDATRFVRNEATVDKIRIQITRRSKLTKKISVLAINMLFPGAGNLLQNAPFSLSDTLLLLSTSLVFGFYILIIRTRPFITSGQQEYLYLLVISLLYSSCFLLVNGFALFKEVSKHIQTKED